jgi:ArsR family transcriptional regulator
MSTAAPAIDLARTARWFHALSDETRLRIVLMLARGERCVCDLQSELDAAQSRLSFHLKTLKTAGLVTDRREGRWVHYALNPDVLDAISALAAGLETEARACCSQNACCG